MRQSQALVLMVMAGLIVMLSWRIAAAAQPDTTTTLELLGAPESDRPVHIPIPRSAIQSFTYEGMAQKIEVTGERIVVDYDSSRCEFDRASGRLAARRTRVDGRPPQPQTAIKMKIEPKLVGPGVVLQYFQWNEPRPAAVEAARAEFARKTWRALQPTEFLNNLTHGDVLQARGRWGTWGAILNAINEASYLEATPSGGGAARRYTMKDGLASNMVTHFAQAEGTLWVSCVDIYDKAKSAWGPGGLCRYDAAADRWARVDAVAGHPVRWVTLLQAVGDELWIGFVEGDGIEGDSVGYGMGIYPGHYQPTIKAVALARLKGGKWDVFTREPVLQPNSTERPVRVLRHNNQIFLFSQNRSRYSFGNWDNTGHGFCSWLDPATGQWHVFSLDKEIDADELMNVQEEQGEVLASTDRGVYRWQDGVQQWQLLDPQSPLKNPMISALAARDGEVWVGYQKQGFGVTGEQGLSRYDERTRQWRWMPPQELGTSCPVTDIATLPDGSLWVLFKPRGYYGAAAEFPVRLRERVLRTTYTLGIGRYVHDKWEFPVALSGVPTTETTQVKTPKGEASTFSDNLPIASMAAAAGRLFVANRAGVFMGPEPWTHIYEVAREAAGHYPYENKLQLQATPDGQTLVITMRDPWPGSNSQPISQATYRPGDAKVEFRNVTSQGSARSEDASKVKRTPKVTDDNTNTILINLADGNKRYEEGWTPLPNRSQGNWYFGRIEKQPRHGVAADRIFETPNALWFVYDGELIRLDRGWFEQQTGARANKAN